MIAVWIWGFERWGLGMIEFLVFCFVNFLDCIGVVIFKEGVIT